MSIHSHYSGWTATVLITNHSKLIIILYVMQWLHAIHQTAVRGHATLTMGLEGRCVDKLSASVDAIARLRKNKLSRHLSSNKSVVGFVCVSYHVFYTGHTGCFDRTTESYNICCRTPNLRPSEASDAQLRCFNLITKQTSSYIELVRSLTHARSVERERGSWLSHTLVCISGWMRCSTAGNVLPQIEETTSLRLLRCTSPIALYN